MNNLKEAEANLKLATGDPYLYYAIVHALIAIAKSLRGIETMLDELGSVLAD